MLLFADREELAEGRHGGDGYSNVLFEAARDGLVVLSGMRKAILGERVGKEEGRRV